MEAQAGLARQQQRLAGAAYGPSVGLGYFNQSLEQVAGFQGYQLTVGVPLAFFDRRAAHKASRYEAQSAQLAYEAGSLRFQYEQSQAEADLQLQRDRLLYYQEVALPRATAILQQANRLFEQGEIEYFEYLQSLDAVLNVRLERLQHELSFQLATNKWAEMNNAYGY